jgi:hypothetical protein
MALLNMTIELTDLAKRVARRDIHGDQDLGLERAGPVMHQCHTASGKI